MKWYKKYLSIYEKEYKDIPIETINEVRNKTTKLQNDNPLVSIVIIAYNEEKHLLANLWSLSDTICHYPIEIIGIDNNSVDATADIYKNTGVKYYKEERHGCGYARQSGMDHAKGKYCVCMDADTIYPPHYVEIMSKKLICSPQNIGVYSLWSYFPDNNHSYLGLKIYESLRDLYLFLQSFKRPELNVRGMVFAYRIEEGKKVGFRVDIKRGEDGSLALGLKKYGKLFFLHNKKARAITGYGTMNIDGSFFNSFKKRAIKAMKNGFCIFKKKSKYMDQESNIIK